MTKTYIKKSLTPGLVMGKSSIDRNGVFADRQFTKGEVVCTLQGREIGIMDIERIYLNGLNRISTDGYQISDTSYLFLDTFSGSINHSCNPTCGVIDRSTLVAMRDIKVGEEITYDYSTVEWTPQEYQIYDYSEWPMVCRCGERTCRKLITCFPYLPDVVKERYVYAGMIPEHIKNRLAQPEKETRCSVCEHVLRVRSS